MKLSMTRNQELGLWTVAAAMLTQLTPLFDGNRIAHYICLAIGAGMSTRAAYLVKSEPRESEQPVPPTQNMPPFSVPAANAPAPAPFVSAMVAPRVAQPAPQDPENLNET